MHDPSDAALVAEALGGREAAYAALMRRHRDLVFRIARGHTGSDDDAIEVTQTSFIAAFAALDRYDPARPFAHWIARIAINKARDLLRRRKVRRLFAFALPLDEAGELAADGVPPDRALDDRAALARALRLIAALPAKLKDVLVLRTITGLDERETADLLGVSCKTVEMRLYRARARLKEKMREQAPDRV